MGLDTSSTHMIIFGKFTVNIGDRYARATYVHTYIHKLGDRYIDGLY